MEARAINPRGTPTPTPIAVSREVLDPLSDGTGVAVLEGIGLEDEFRASAATPGIAVPLGTLTDLKFPQSTFFLVSSHEAVPQQCSVLLPLYFAATIGNPDFLL